MQLRCLAFSYTTLFGVKNITLSPNTGLFLAYILNYQAFTVVRPQFTESVDYGIYTQRKSDPRNYYEWVSVQTGADQSGLATLLNVSRQAGIETEVRSIVN